jgi:bifunctional DNase/RNase
MGDSKDIIQVDIFGLSLSSTVSGGGYAIILKEVNGERRLPIIIGQFEAQAIALELEGIKPPRPLTHDLLKTIIENFGFSIDNITIDELKDSTFYAKIRFNSSAIDEIDARPSDAIAIALKFSAPIYVSSYIMDEIGFIPDLENKEDELKSSDQDQIVSKSKDSKDLSKEQKLQQLKSDLDSAVINEDYEKAAQLRDEIKKLEISNLN